MSEGRRRKSFANPRRAQELRELRQRAATEPATARREHVEPVDITRNEEKYEPFLLAIEAGLLEVWDEREHLPIDEEAERALRLVITRFEGDSERRSGSPDVDAMADAVGRQIDRFFRRNALLSRAEIIGCLRRIMYSISTWHTPQNPRAYFEYAEEYRAVTGKTPPASQAEQRDGSRLWVPGRAPASDVAEPEPHRPGGIWLPGDRL